MSKTAEDQLVRENKLVREIRDIESEKTALVRRIAVARSDGRRDVDAITQLGVLGRRKVKLTRPKLFAR